MSSLALDGVTPRSRRRDPVTSVDAGRSVHLAESQEAVLVLLHEIGWPVSDRELVDHAAQRGNRYSPQRIRSARAELAEAGLVELVEDEFRRSPSGRREQVWRPSRPADTNEENTNEREATLWE